MKISFNIIGSLVLRVISVFPKFLLLIIIGKFFSVDDLGIFGIFNSTVIISTFVIGLNFYTFSTRELIIADKNEKTLILVRQFFLFGFAYILICPLLLVSFFLKIISWEYIYMYYSITILEHLTQEIYRVLVALSLPLKAGLVFFLKSGFWCALLVFFWYLKVPSIPLTLNSIWCFWVFGLVLSLFIGIIALKDYLIVTNISDIFTNYSLVWVIKGLKISSIFFYIEILYKILENSGRYMLSGFHNNILVGVFVFFSQIANLTNIVVESSIVMFEYPKLISLYKLRDFQLFDKRIRLFFFQVIGISILTGCLISAFLPFLLMYLNKSIFIDYKYAFYAIFINSTILNISLVYHYGLYATNKNDKELFISTIISTVLNIILMILLTPNYDIWGVIIASIISSIAILFLKLYYYKKIER